ncbi:hypothetical protein [Polyangium sp. 15x6]|uniref:hypothetical protein n=1 Tax=Polyangium sp. 15x6 TaxID=3042687 RepID=UPI00249CDA1A|nr:hypothetical protein [Polyangium sp. 15x6]
MYVPTTGLDLAKAYGELGRLVEAREVILEVLKLPANGNAAFVAAQAEAADILKALDTRIPSIHLRVTGPPSDNVRVAVDGVAITDSKIEAPRRLDPGSHDIVASAPGFVTEQRRVTLEEGDTKPMQVGIVMAPVAKTRLFPDRQEEAQPSPRSRSLIYAGAGLSGALVVVGIGTAIGTNIAHAGAQDAVNGVGCAGYDACKAVYERNVSQQVGLAYTSLFSFIGAGAVGTATLIYALTGKRQAADTKVVSRASLVVAPGLGGVVVQGVW